MGMVFIIELTQLRLSVPSVYFQPTFEHNLNKLGLPRQFAGRGERGERMWVRGDLPIFFWTVGRKEEILKDRQDT